MPRCSMKTCPKSEYDVCTKRSLVIIYMSSSGFVSALDVLSKSDTSDTKNELLPFHGELNRDVETSATGTNCSDMSMIF